MGKASKAKRASRKYASREDQPLTILEQMETEYQIGEEGWYLERRKTHPAKKISAAENTVLLSMDLLKKSTRDPLPSFIPKEAPLFPGGPRSFGSPHPEYLRRFRGQRVLPLGNTTQIFDGESRQVYRDTSYPWVCIGRLIKPNGTWCTASLVGRSVILTANHSLRGFWEAGQPLRERITFVPASFDNVSLLGADWHALVTNIAAWATSIEDVDGYDMAICQLDQPMGEWLGTFGARAYDDDWEDRAVWAHAGYPWDFSMGGHRPTFELGIAVRDDDGDSFDTLEVETRADSGSGQSGGPLWGVFGGDRQVIGTLSGIEDNFGEPKNTLFAGGNGLVNLIRWGRENWN